MNFPRFISGIRLKLHAVSALVKGYSSTSYSYRTHTCGELGLDEVGERVTLCGWVRKKRDVGGLEFVFLPLADSTGLTQLTLDRKQWEKFITTIKSESVVRASGIVHERPDIDKRESTGTGTIEVRVDDIETLNDVNSDVLFFSPASKGLNVTEELSLRERALILRRPQMQQNLRLRSKLAMTIREFLIYNHGFVEVETPTLFKRTPKGAREFLVPTRIPRKFYSLAQSPQQFKQLLMVGGFDRYFQFARCYRDEDPKADRQPEFTQVDLEMSFVDSNGVMGLIEELLSSTLSRTVPHLDVTPPPFPRIPFQQAMDEYGSDKPDTREDKNDSSKLNFLWVTDFPLLSRKETEDGYESTHHPFTAPVPEDEELLFSADERILEKVRGQHYDLVVNGVELGGGSIRIHRAALQEHILRNLFNVPCDEFSHLLKGLRQGCPPHGGIALGFDRLMAVICNASRLKEVIAFPKSINGRDLYVGAPSKVEDSILKDYHITTID